MRETEQVAKSGASDQQAISRGQQLAGEYFRAQMADHQIPYSGQFSAQVSINNLTYSGTANYTGESPLTLAKIFESPPLPISIESAANIAGQEYNEIHIVIDNSASMGVGADNASIARMATAINCAFACHIPAGLPGYSDTHIAARNAGAELRIDVVKRAAIDLVGSLQAEGYGDLMSVAVHTFSNSLTTVQPSTSDLALVQTALGTVELSNELNEGGTGFDRSIDQLESIVGISGDGSRSTARRKSVILVTDGVSTNIAFDLAGPNVGSENPAFRAFSPVINGAPGAWFTSQGFDDRLCNDLKNRNQATVITLNVEYVIPTVGTDGDTRFSEINNVLKPDIERHMQDCASSPALARTANDPVDIRAAMAELLQNLQSYTLRLTN
ncbi:MAG: vWA domain-containing protein [Ahrensia sp.]